MAINKYGPRPWDFDVTSLYSYIDAFLQRCRDLLEVCQAQQLMIDAAERKQMLASADALDAVLAAFGAKAAANRTLAKEKPANWKIEGAIAVHR